MMLVGYSLEVCLNGRIVFRDGVGEFIRGERKHFHHRLDGFSAFITDLDDKERAILRGLTHLASWAG